MKLPRFASALALTASLALVPTAAAQAAPATHPVIVRVLASGGWKALPVVGARLRLKQGGRVIAAGRTGSLGMATLAARPGRGPVQVLATGGTISGRPFRGKMAAEAQRYRWPATIHVDSVTTLAGRYHHAHPRLSAAKAKGRTKRFLLLPSHYVLGRDGRSDAAFDGRRFLAAAGTGRRYDRFVGRMARRIGNPKAHRSFAHLAARRHHSKGARAQSAVQSADELAQVTNDVAKAEGFFSMLEKGNEVLDFAHVAMQIAGVDSSGASAAEVQQLSNQLQQVEQSIGVVQATEEELRGQVLHSQYSQLANEVEEAQSAVESAEDTIHSAAELARQEGCLPEPQPITPACEDVRQMIVGNDGFSQNLRNAQLVTPSEVNAFAERIAGAGLPGAPAEAQGLLQDGSALTTYAPHQLFFTTADSEDLQSIAAYWTSYYTEALALVATNWEAEGASPDTLANDVEQISAKAHVFPSLMPAAVPPGTAIDMVHGWMWPTEATGMGTSHPFTWFEENGPWSFPASTREWTSTANPAESFGAWISESAPELPFGNWTIAGRGQIVGLLEAVTPQGGQLPGAAVVQQSGMDWENLTPRYEWGGHGLETEYDGSEGGNLNSGCKYFNAASCWWPIWVGDGGTITNFHAPDANRHYTLGTFETAWYDVKWDGLKLWGYDNEGTIYGNAPENAIPNLFYRQISGGECYFYPAPEHPAAGSPGCR